MVSIVLQHSIMINCRNISKFVSRLFTLNNDLISLNISLEEKVVEHLNLKIQYRRQIYKYKDFLKQQEEQKNNEEETTDPDLAR